MQHSRVKPYVKVKFNQEATSDLCKNEITGKFSILRSVSSDFKSLPEVRIKFRQSDDLAPEIKPPAESQDK